MFLYSHHLCAWYGIGILRTNSVLFTHGNKRVNGEKFRERLSLSQLEDELNICIGFKIVETETESIRNL